MSQPSMIEERRPYCCFIEPNGESCPEQAVWRAYWDGPPADSNTDGCEAHIGALLDPAYQGIILTPITAPEAA